MYLKGAIGVLLVAAVTGGFIMLPGLLLARFPNLQGSQLIEGLYGATPGGVAAAIIAAVHIILVAVKGEPGSATTNE